MRVLLVLAHPLPESFNAAVAAVAREALEAAGHEVDFLDLYQEGFDPRLREEERRGYFAIPYDASGIGDLAPRLAKAQALVLVFPQWWFNFPAILKGFFDRVLVPGVAFDHDPEGGRIVPRLDNITRLVALTTTGSPWWIVHFYMGNPVRRLLKRGIGAFCSRRLAFHMLSLHDMDRATLEKRTRFLERVRLSLSRL